MTLLPMSSFGTHCGKSAKVSCLCSTNFHVVDAAITGGNLSTESHSAENKEFELKSAMVGRLGWWNTVVERGVLAEYHITDAHSTSLSL
jgi:hypothetical protein